MFELSRRALLKTMSCGFGYMAFAGLATEAAQKEKKAADYENPLAPKAPHFPPRAKRVIFLCMRGGPSHVDTFDYKPMLAKHEGKTPDGANQRGRKLMPSPWKFIPSGESGLLISELYPHLRQHADDLCLINSCHTDLPNHPQALVQLHTGQFRFVRPSIGSWVLYGLGTENQDLPGFITIKPPARLGGAQNYGSAFLPAVYQGTKIGDPGQALRDIRVENIANPLYSSDVQRKQLNLLQMLNRNLAQRSDNAELEGVIESYELAFKMQTALPKLLDLSKETTATHKLYGIGEKETDDFGRQCLIARRCAEAGVRFIELTHEGWDQHNGLRARLSANARATDKPMAALITDLKRLDMLKDTLIIWGGEFGRTPAVRNKDGRDHNATGFTMWMAGGGVRGGMRYGATDDYGINAEIKKFHIHDFHATTLHLLGLDHTRLTYRYAGRDFRLTDVYGNVATEIIS
ncbi:MAG: sulfatase [Gemmatales bacterium]|nr:MAG: sulfatase [Gemmatales bacterium]